MALAHVNRSCGTDSHVPRGLAAKRDFRAIHLKHPGIAAWRATACGNYGTRKEAKLHQTPRIVAREIDGIEDRRVAPAQIEQSAVATQLHLCLSLTRFQPRCQ